MKIAIVLLNWRGAVDTIDCIRSIMQQGPVSAFRTIVVDNASGDQSVERIMQFCKDSGYPAACKQHRLELGEIAGDDHGEESIVVIAANSNLGFCAGNNLGAEYAFELGADAVLVLNNDTTVAPDLIEKLAAGARDLGPEVLVSPQILYHDDQSTVWWCGGEFSGLLGPAYRHQGSQRISPDGTYPRTNWVSGCATLISRELYLKIGLYDPVFFIWCEEWDLSLRAQSRGIDMRVVPAAIVYHKVGRSLGIVSPLTFFYSMRNMIILRRRYLSFAKRAALAIVYFPRKLLQAFLYSLKYQDRRYLLACLDAMTDSSGGIWKRQ